ncbi:hypothetical protein CDAR_496041 [Caerostris darwini]|uniref:Uncharacterized protein n=1 Tax=Caerostris darwini TaxID=1538125 RepID=A0AAV4U1Q5_9ARAC|nr:hypothetical protein CDAR_496041 [Caerostris darwini]
MGRNPHFPIMQVNDAVNQRGCPARPKFGSVSFGVVAPRQLPRHPIDRGCLFCSAFQFIGTVLSRGWMSRVRQDALPKAWNGN